MNITAVIGLGFGDEGKGLTTSYLVSQSEAPLVVRFNGGHQAGHTVVHNGIRHVFSNYGSGSLQNAPTYWSKFCTVNPNALGNEFNILKEKGITPKIYIDPMCPVTTPFDIIWNQENERRNKHGSVGVGFGSTIERQENFYKLHYQDLFFKDVFNEKLKNIIEYYFRKAAPSTSRPQRDYYMRKWIPLKEEFMETVASLIDKGIMTNENTNFHLYDHLIFEGAQGVLLDMDHGFFPNVTRSNTTSKNVYEVLKQHNQYLPQIDVMYVSRTYQTRHGNGFMTNEHIPVKLKNNENETNVSHQWQGNFRISALDVDLLKYALKADANYSSRAFRRIMFTCTDQTDEMITYTKNGKVYKNHVMAIADEIFPDNSTTYLSTGPEAKQAFKIYD